MIDLMIIIVHNVGTLVENIGKRKITDNLMTEGIERVSAAATL
jgi:hypothetical protein